MPRAPYYSPSNIPTTRRFSDDRLQEIAAEEGLDWANLPDEEKALFREIQELNRPPEIETPIAEGDIYIPPLTRSPKNEEYLLDWDTFQLRFLVHLDIPKDEKSRRKRAWNMRNKYRTKMKGPGPRMTQEECKNYFWYNPTEGELYWKNPPTHFTKRATKVGTPKTGTKTVRRVRVNYREYQLSHLVFLYHEGHYPRRLKHLNGDNQDIRIENLMEM